MFYTVGLTGAIHGLPEPDSASEVVQMMQLHTTLLAPRGLVSEPTLRHVTRLQTSRKERQKKRTYYLRSSCNIRTMTVVHTLCTGMSVSRA